MSSSVMSNPGFGSSEKACGGFGGDGGPVDMEILKARFHGRYERKADAKLFKREYMYSDDITERRTCISSNNISQNVAKSSGIVWIGVCGKNTMCVVTMKRDVDLGRARFHSTYCTKDAMLRKFRKTVISEMEDLEGPNNDGKCIKTPFSVVCVTDNPHHTSCDVTDKGSGLEGSRYYYKQKEEAWDLLLGELKKTKLPCEFDTKDAGQFERRKNRLVSTVKKTTMARSIFAECDEGKAIEFLKEKMEKGSTEDLTVEKSIQIAISAFQHLLKRKFKAHEIEVSYIDPHYKIWSHGIIRTSSLNFMDLNFDRIDEHLTIINGGRKKKASEKEDLME